MIAKALLSYPRAIKRTFVVINDCLLVTFSLWLGFSLRLGEFFLPIGPDSRFAYLFVLAPVLALAIFPFFGLYKVIIRYVGSLAMWSIARAVTIYSLAFGVLVLMSGISGVPRSVILINWILTFALIAGSRIVARWLFTGNQHHVHPVRQRTRVAIYGAGGAGIQIAAALASGNQYKPVVFIDDNPALQGNYIAGLPVYAPKRLGGMIDRLDISEILLAMPSVARSRRSEIIAMLETLPLHITTLPGLDDLASGRVKVDDIREVGVGDLLGRDPVEPDSALLQANVRDKVVLVSGAGGSIGSELCRQILKIGPRKLVLYERGEHDLYLLDQELRQQVARQYPESGAADSLVVPILASVLDQERLEAVCETFGVQTIYHAAAYKHVPMVERNPTEAVRNNVFGTWRAAQAAQNTGVETFVLISTDKAVRPTSTMGATKRFAELILQALAGRRGGGTRFTMVRFGNVLGSSGSVVPLFRQQIEKGGPVTVTDPTIIRYFMTIPEAAQLVIQAGAMGKGGEVYVLDMGEPVKILDLARRMIHLSGLEVRDAATPDGDIEIVFTGLRPGEKLYEELLIGENVAQTRHPLIMSANEKTLDWSQVSSFLEQFDDSVTQQDVGRIRRLLVDAVDDFRPQCDVADLVQESRADNVIRYPG